MNRTQTGGYVLKFISGKYQGGEFPLEIDTEIEIGRGSELDMVLVEDMVSRRHARITSYAGELSIEDFGSTNGTFVNGEKITKSRIKEGDRILIGTNIIKLVHRDRTIDESGVNMTPGASRMPPPSNGQPGMNARATGATLTGSISGLIEEVPLPDLLQLFSTSRKSGVLVILGDDIGKIFLRTGRVYFATINDDVELDPYKAFYRLIAWRQG
ncbi:MAG: FHA domain-containing protein, partial [Bradymonadaceae bacterium]